MNNTSIIGLVALTVVLVVGCAAHPDRDTIPVRDAGGLGMYSALDATAQVYSHPMAQAPVEDNPWRWVGFVMHPFGVALDYTLVRPFYALASTFPKAFGYTSEDALIDSRRRQ